MNFHVGIHVDRLYAQSSKNRLKIAILKRFSKDFKQIQSRFPDIYLSLACNLLQYFCVNRALTLVLILCIFTCRRLSISIRL